MARIVDGVSSTHEPPATIASGAVAYSIDFADPINFLGIWMNCGRHFWRNQKFDSILDEASHLMGDAEPRDKLFRETERILIDDVGGT